MHHLQDEELLRAFSEGKEEGFEVLVHRHGPAIKAYALRMLGNPQQAEEVFAETFLRVVTARGRWESRGTVRGYFFTLAHRICIDLLRRRRTVRKAQPMLLELTRRHSIAPSPEAHAALGERAVLLEQALVRLPEEHRQVLLMRVVHQLSALETSQALGLSESQVHSQLSYARKRLKSLIVQPTAAIQRRS